MFWDKVAFAYDFFETVYKGKCYGEYGGKTSRAFRSPL